MEIESVFLFISNFDVFKSKLKTLTEVLSVKLKTISFSSSMGCQNPKWNLAEEWLVVLKYERKRLEGMMSVKGFVLSIVFSTCQEDKWDLKIVTEGTYRDVKGRGGSRVKN